MRKASGTETGGQDKESDSQAQSCLSQQKPRGHVGCSRSSMSGSTESGLVACRMGYHAERRRRSHRRESSLKPVVSDAESS